MKKIRLLVLVLLILSGSLYGCTKEAPLKDSGLEDNSNNTSNNEDNKNQVFLADVIDSKDGLLITPDKDSIESSSSDRISVATGEAEIIDDKGNVINVDVLKSGDRIKVSYDGMIAESYPAQITANKIELLGRNNLIDGFLALIDDLYQTDSGLNGGITMIAFDTTDWTMLSAIETEIILAIAKEEYKLEVLVGTFDELAEQELIDKDNLYFENGILIVIEEIEINNDKDKISCSIRKWRSGLGAIGWDAEARLTKDKWEITRSGMWIS
ncbi:MAG: DUF3221 domain-containing protein [Anaerolineaceae bacterium]|nr:MAG: DUF3221 domain-containing protein [Anaerolineaceae bacterium]